MLSIQKSRISYDSQYDTFNYKIKDTSNSYGDEDIEDIVVLRDFDTDDVTGYTIMNLHRIIMEHSSGYEYLAKNFDIESLLAFCKNEGYSAL